MRLTLADLFVSSCGPRGVGQFFFCFFSGLTDQLFWNFLGSSWELLGAFWNLLFVDVSVDSLSMAISARFRRWEVAGATKTATLGGAEMDRRNGETWE